MVDMAEKIASGWQFVATKKALLYDAMWKFKMVLGGSETIRFQIKEHEFHL